MTRRRFSWIVPAIYIVFLLLPIYWLVNMSFKTNAEITSGFSLWPQQPTLRNYSVIFTDPSWYSGYINSIIYVALNTVISVAAAVPAADAGARASGSGSRLAAEARGGGVSSASSSCGASACPPGSLSFWPRKMDDERPIPLASFRASTVVPSRIAMPNRVSPDLTV